RHPATTTPQTATPARDDEVTMATSSSTNRIQKIHARRHDVHAARARQHGRTELTTIAEALASAAAGVVKRASASAAKPRMPEESSRAKLIAVPTPSPTASVTSTMRSRRVESTYAESVV